MANEEFFLSGSMTIGWASWGSYFVLEKN